MNQFRPVPAPYDRCVDWLFARMDDPPGGLPLPNSPPGGPPTLSPIAPPQTFVALPADWPQPPPALDGPDALRNAHEWFRAERRRLDEYTQGQLAAIQQKHYDTLGQHYRNEADLVRREQEVNRELRLLTTQAEALRERTRGLVEWEEGLVAQTEKLARLQREQLAALQAGGAAAVGEQECLVAAEALRAEVSQRRLSEAAAQAKFEATEALLKERQLVWEKKHAEVLARQQQLERRCLELERAEAAMQRRLAEMDELEDRLLRSFEKD